MKLTVELTAADLINLAKSKLEDSGMITTGKVEGQVIIKDKNPTEGLWFTTRMVPDGPPGLTTITVELEIPDPEGKK